MSHATQIATRGRLTDNSFILSSSGYLIKIIEQPTPQKFKVAVTRKNKDKTKIIKIEVMVNGKTNELIKKVKPNVKISIDDIEIFERSPKNVEIFISGGASSPFKH